MFRQVLKRLSDNITARGLHTHQAIIRSAYGTLFLESQISVTQITLETLYASLCTSATYHDCAEYIIYHIVVDQLKLDIKDVEKHVLIENTNSQSKAILQSREVKFIDLLTSLSYMTKESLIGAKILPKSVKKSKEDAADLISSSVCNGDLVATPECLKKLMKSVTGDSLRKQVKAALDAPEWVNADSMLKLNAARKPLKTSQQAQPDVVEPDSPKSQDVKVIEALSPGKKYYTISYRIMGNFRGRKLSWIGEK